MSEWTFESNRGVFSFFFFKKNFYWSTVVLQCCVSFYYSKVNQLYIYVCMHAQSLSCVRLCATPWTVAHQAPLSLGLSRREYWSRLPRPSSRDLPHPGIEPTSLAALALACGFFTISATWEAQQKRWTACKTRQKLKMPSTSSPVDPTQVKKDQTLRQVKRNYPHWNKNEECLGWVYQ